MLPIARSDIKLIASFRLQHLQRPCLCALHFDTAVVEQQGADVSVSQRCTRRGASRLLSASERGVFTRICCLAQRAGEMYTSVYAPLRQSYDALYFRYD